ncbi:helix-turn-helix domain-containing protein [Streptomyces sp. NPDC051018]|uniref:helix-turn-helix domain-containing protein n=1 Tax=Streptomyces sp. NPDC051018 TaxID=3365639 RepID=UPI0037B8CA98
MQHAPTPPFDRSAARRLREALGMTAGHVSYGLRAQYGLHVRQDTILSWERGIGAPGDRELTALAGVLWCAPEDLVDAATTLEDHRLARELAADELARLIGMTPGAYARMEESGRWRGSERHTALLAEVLRLRPRELLRAIGRDGELAPLLRSAVKGRWQGYVRPVAKLVPMDRELITAVLEELHTAYRVRTADAGPGWAQTAEDSEAAGREFLELVGDHFWVLADPDPDQRGGDDGDRTLPG